MEDVANVRAVNLKIVASAHSALICHVLEDQEKSLHSLEMSTYSKCTTTHSSLDSHTLLIQSMFFKLLGITIR